MLYPIKTKAKYYFDLKPFESDYFSILFVGDKEGVLSEDVVDIVISLDGSHKSFDNLGTKLMEIQKMCFKQVNESVSVDYTTFIDSEFKLLKEYLRLNTTKK